MKILFMGTPDFAVVSLDKLISQKYEIVGVFTQPDKPQGRKKILTSPPVKLLALEHNIDVYQPETLKNDDIKEILEKKAPDIIVVVAYGKILPEYILNFPKYGCINVHGSILPRWRGAAPIQWSIISGDKTAGVTTMRMSKGLDTGDILLKQEIDIKQNETAGQLFERLSVVGADLLDKTLKNIENIKPQPQDESKANYAHMLSKDMSFIDWSLKNTQIHCFIRGLNPWPIATTKFNDKQMKIYSSSLCEKTGKIGEVISADEKTGIVVGCGQGSIIIEEMQVVGGKRMSSKDYVRGHKIELGNTFGE